MLSIVIPTLNAARTLDRSLGSVAAPIFPVEVVVADGGSTDDTKQVAALRRARVLSLFPGRGSQLADGAKAAAGDWLLFLHADTRLLPGWDEAAARFMGRPENRMKAGVFRFMLDDDHIGARRIERGVAWRIRHFGLPYGDQGLLISRAFYDALGGFRKIPIMEDVDMAQRIGKDRIVVLDAGACTSAERYRRDGYVLRPLRNLLCLGLYFCGLSPSIIQRIYQ